jgi:hypothetical protein
VRPPPKHSHYPAETRKGGADAGKAQEDVQDMLVHGGILRAFCAACVHDSKKLCVRQRTDLRIAARHTCPMETYLSPRKSLIAIGVVCALSAIALLVGRTPSPAPARGADNPAQLHANPDLDSQTPHRK